MSGSYIALAGILFYIFIARTLDAKSMNPVKAAALLIGGYYGLLLITLALEYSAHDIPIFSNLFSLERILTALIQFAIAVGVFHKAEEAGDEYLSYIFWTGLGLALIFFIMPAIVRSAVMAL